MATVKYQQPDPLVELAVAAAARKDTADRALAAMILLRQWIVAAHEAGHSEYVIARVGQCDRMTVRRALGKQ